MHADTASTADAHSLNFASFSARPSPLAEALRERPLALAARPALPLPLPCRGERPLVVRTFFSAGAKEIPGGATTATSA